jgi:hypothetical protein
MADHRETRTVVKEVVEVVRDWTTCDFCCAEIKAAVYEVHEGEIRLKVGSSYPDGGNGTEIRVDVCQGCFHSKVVPWLKSQGVEPIEKEWDW